MDEEEKDERQHGLEDWRRSGVNGGAYGPANEYGGEQEEQSTRSRTRGGGRTVDSDQWATRTLWWAADEQNTSAGAQATRPHRQRATVRGGAANPGVDCSVLTPPPPEPRPEPRPKSQSSASFDGVLPETDEAKRERRRGRTCKADGCNKYIVHKGLCCRHGGGKKCSADGCESSAKHKGRCWRHGGSVECKRLGCTKRAKARGLCWGHGGGTQCLTDGCEKVAVSNSLCWAHGGGKRCIDDGCQRPAYARTHDFCKKHYEELQDVDYYEV